MSGFSLLAAQHFLLSHVLYFHISPRHHRRLQFIRIVYIFLQTAKSPTLSYRAFLIRSLAMSYSHMGTPTLPSALTRFTSEFGMGSGGTMSLLSLDKNVINQARTQLINQSWNSDINKSVLIQYISVRDITLQ